MSGLYGYQDLAPVGACRSDIWTTEISRQGDTYTQNNVWRFNNQVLFTT